MLMRMLQQRTPAAATTITTRILPQTLFSIILTTVTYFNNSMMALLFAPDFCQLKWTQLLVKLTGEVIRFWPWKASFCAVERTPCLMHTPPF
jgi:hypothetical protein